ncbi:MAG: hypothetical protein NTW96_27600 [Planctomycetia bacterium]|nr:hypothetical protein [Planctomycetia bacterium]
MATDKHCRLRSRIEKRLCSWYGLSCSRLRADGLAWYRAAREFCNLLSETYGVPLVRVCGVVAALSPAVYWALNKRQAEALIQAYVDQEDPAGVAVSTYGSQAAKAREILALADLGPDPAARVAGILGAQARKTRAFFSNLMHLSSQEVTVDRHIVAACGLADRFVGNSAVWLYRVVAEAVGNVAEELMLRPYELQAIVWLTYKETAEAYSAAEGARPAAEAPF